MTTTYEARLNDVPSDDFSQTIVAGSVQLELAFRWDNEMQEQYDILHKALVDRALADPLIDDNGTIDRDYDWIEWHLSLPNDIETYLEEGGKYPQSMRKVDNIVKADLLTVAKEEAKELDAIVTAYADNLRWHCTITDPNGVRYARTVEPGAWVNEQSIDWRFRFECDLPTVGHDDLLKVALVTEVIDDYEDVV